MIDIFSKTIRYSLYALFLLTPLVFTNNTSELFELNKMWAAWALTAVIIGAWIGKMILTRDFRIRRTPLDIPIAIFLISQIISTIFSLDQRVSFFGYYSRFNGGLLSMASYIALYYAIVSNLSKENVLSLVKLGIISGIVVALWGLPSHFGYDPTCLLFRGELNVSCWTDAFKPTIRIFSMLGQPAWLASFLALLIPLVMAPLISISEKKNSFKDHLKDKRVIILVAVIILFYADLLFANTRAGFLAFWAGMAVLWGLHFIRNRSNYKKLLPVLLFTTLSFFFLNAAVGTPLAQLNKFSFASILAPKTVAPEQEQAKTVGADSMNGINITDSADIRVLVWEGAIKAWQASPIIGSGVETFAYAYYAHRPAEHNMTSEWDYLYNKAHNEYLNYLTTTGLLGLLSYLAIFALFFFYALKKLVFASKSLSSQDYTMGSAIIASLVTILIANFFGFSVVITNIYLFMLPLFFFIILEYKLPEKFVGIKMETSKHETTNAYQWTGLTAVFLFVLVSLFLLLRFWQADVSYALGNNLDKVGDYQNAYTHLNKAYLIRKTEPVIKDEFSINLATLSTALYQSQQATTSSQLASQAVMLSDEVVRDHPNNVIYWKSRTRIFYLLGQIDPKYLAKALEAIEKAQKLAPSDAKVSYNLGVLQGQNNKLEDAIKTLTNTVKLKPDYRDAYYARALFYRQLGSNAQGGVTDQELAQKAVDDMRFILKNISPDDPEVLKVLTSWNEKP